MSKVIVLDPGHGYKTNLGLNGYYESVGNLLACKQLKKELEAYGFVVHMTRSTDNANPSISTQRGQLAAQKKADLFISWHSDANANKNIRGVTVFNSVVRRSASAVAFAERMADTIAATMGIPLSPYAAAKNGVYHKGNGSGRDYYAVLRGATSGGNVPMAMLIEHGFHTNPADVGVLDSSTRRAALAKAEAKCIANWFGVSLPGNETAPGKLYRVQTGAFSTEAAAQKFAAELKAKGYPSIIV